MLCTWDADLMRTSASPASRSVVATVTGGSQWWWRQRRREHKCMRGQWETKPIQVLRFGKPRASALLPGARTGVMGVGELRMLPFDNLVAGCFGLLGCHNLTTWQQPHNRTSWFYKIKVTFRSFKYLVQSKWVTSHRIWSL